MISISTSLGYYKRSDIREEMTYNCRDREIAAKFNDSFAKRPDIIRHSGDILELAKQGATSFHASEEIWKNPLQLDTSLRKSELDSLRAGWDLIIDIDCGFFEYSKIAADIIIKALKFHGIGSISCKFSGNKGFHIGVPFEAFPEKIGSMEIHALFPQAPRRIALYLKEMIKRPLGTEIEKFEQGNFNLIIEKTGKTAAEITYKEDQTIKLNAEPFLTIDTLLISSRHLYRMAYSLNEKSQLASVPIDPSEVLNFKKETAMPKNVAVSSKRFLDTSSIKKDEAKQLLVQAYDFCTRHEQQEQQSSPKAEFKQVESALSEDIFPPCIKIILDGLEDGKKRALFILINYLTSVGWDYDMVEKKLREWNSKNKEPIREVYLLGQIRYHKQMKKLIPPPNCKNEMYMLGIGVCRPDGFCPRIKNPAQYSTKKAWMAGKKGK